MSSEVLLEKRAGIARLTLNRPNVKNALTSSMCADIVAFISELRADTSVRVFVIGGNGADFCAGADLKEMGAALSPSSEQRRKDISQKARDVAWPIFLSGMHELPMPIVSSVRGHTIGAGTQFVLSSDLAVASQTTKFLLPQVRLGHNVDHGESYFLPRKIGLARTMQMILLGETVNGTDAERYGLVNWVVPDGELEAKTEQVVQNIVAGSPVAIREMKSLVRHSQERTIKEQFAAEADSLGTCAATEDFIEAIKAFAEKRPATFKGR
ncbi:MAG: enoyl-CoA hydratase-related protein [Steroidobacteraceae bacterium]